MAKIEYDFCSDCAYYSLSSTQKVARCRCSKRKSGRAWPKAKPKDKACEYFIPRGAAW